MTKPPSVTIVSWLQSNLGKKCLAGQTGTDQKALLAAVQIIELYSYERDERVIEAFARVVSMMQEKQRFLAYHAIAHVMEWSDRAAIWNAADLEIPRFWPRCEFEPKERV